MNTPQTISQLLARGVEFHKAGRLDTAEAEYNRVLQHDANNADALNLLGAIQHARGQTETALRLFDRAIAASPRHVSAQFNRANTLEVAERYEDAVGAYRAVLQLKPDFPDAYLNLGALYHRLARDGEAASILETLLSKSPGHVAALYNLGHVYAALGDLGKAEAALRAVVKAVPDHADAFFTLANLLAKTGRLNDAIVCARKAVELNAAHAEYRSSLGNWLLQSNDSAAALEMHRSAAKMDRANPKIITNLASALVIAGQPSQALDLLNASEDVVSKHAEALFVKGQCLDDLSQPEEAISAYESSLVIRPDYADAYQALSVAFSNIGQDTTSRLLLRKATSLAPHDAMMRFTEALSLLKSEDFTQGWPAYESRFDLINDERYARKGRSFVRRPSPPPYWSGEALSGKALFLWTEQGVGDEILFSSMLPDVIAAADRVAIHCSARLKPILERSFPSLVVLSDAPPELAASFDYQSSIGSLGRYLRSTLSAFPTHRGYLKADPERTTAFRAKYGAQRLIGLSWKSGAERIGLKKTIPLAAWSRLLRSLSQSSPDVRFVNLQYGDCEQELVELNAQLDSPVLSDPSVNALVDMDAYFAQVAAMDLVLTVSNTAVHVAGALGTPAWMLLPRGAASLWYWFSKRADSPWYPSLGIFRGQYQAGAEWWRQPMQNIEREFAARFANRG